MNHKIQCQVKSIIHAAIFRLLAAGEIPNNEPLEYHIDVIFLETLSQSVDHLSQKLKWRVSEQDTLSALKQDIHDAIDLTTLEQRLIAHLSKIRPRWGELFGTDRGEVYNTFHCIYQWPCFNWHARLYYKEQTSKKGAIQTSHQSHLLSEKSESLETAQQILHRNQASNQQLLDRITQQFITIQTLKKDNHALRQSLKISVPPPIDIAPSSDNTP